MLRRRGDPAHAGGDLENVVLVGRLLRERRQDRGLGLEEVALAIRVAPRHVQAVEEGHIAALPPPPYARGLVSAYATLVGLDAEELLRACGASLAGDGGGRKRIFRYPARNRFIWREWTVPFALAAAVATIVIARAVLSPAPGADAPRENVSPAAARLDRQGEPSEDAPPAPAAPDQPPGGPEVEPTGASVAAPGVRVLLRCEGTTWAEATTDGGEPRRYELGPGQNLEIVARERLSLSLGDAGVVRLKVNERELGFIGYKGQQKTGLSFTAPKASPPAALPAAAGD